MKNVYFVILGGGQGERLWPLSRKDRPKQFVTFLDNKSLLEQTLERVKKLAANKDQIGIVTNTDHKDRVIELVGKDVGFILAEEDGRNTGPAVLYACLDIYKKDPNATVVFLPSDSFVVEAQKYVKSIELAVKFAKKNKKIVTLGVMPTRPSVSYGYIQAENILDEHIKVNSVYNAKKFHEKPSLKTAQDYLKDDSMLWNISVFVSSVSFLINEFKTYAADVFSDMQSYLDGKFDYKDIEKISIDFAVIEKSENIAVIPCDFSWYDVGNIDVFLTLQHRLAKESTKIINVDATNNLASIIPRSINHEKIVAFVGVHNLCVVEDEDVILIAKRSQVEKVKKVLHKIKKESWRDYL